MTGSSGAPFRDVSIVSLPDSSDERDGRLPQHSSDDEILKLDFLDGITHAAQESLDSSSVDGDNSNVANPKPMHDESEDEPNSQLLREAHTGQSPGSSHKRTDEEQAALLNSALFAHGRGPGPLPSRPERRAASRDGGRSATSTPRHNRGPARPDVYELPADSPARNPTSASVKSEAQHEGGGKSKARQLRSSTRAQKQQEPKESEAVQAAATPIVEEPKKRKPGRPKKNPTAAETISKRQKTDSANTGRRRSKAEEAEGSEEAGKRVKRNSSMAATLSNPEASKSTPKKAQTASEKLSRMKAKKTTAKEAPIDEPKSDASVELFVTGSTTESHSSDDESNDDLDGLPHLQELLRKIWVNSKGVKKVREQRKAFGLREHTDSAKSVIHVCREFQNELKSMMEASTASDEAERVSAAIRHLDKKLKEFDLENKEDIKNFLFQDLYAFVIPCLLRTLCNILDFYVKFLKRHDAPDTVPTPRLAEVTRFTATIIKLEERAKASDVQVPTELAIVRPTRHYIIAPLKRLRRLFVQLVARQSKQEERAEGLRVEQRRIEQANARRQRAAEEGAHQRALWEDWRGLHITRKEMEPDIRRWHHLDFVPPPSTCEPEVIRDIDVNGQPFDRVIMFHHTRSPPRRRNWDDLRIEWTDLECLTLMEALAKYTAMEFCNPRHMVYFNIIKKHCGPGGALRPFSVWEIVQKSQYFKRMLEDREWTRLIPTF